MIDPDVVERAVDKAAVRYDRDGDQHYDVISAFIKSIRGSDVQASLHYLARMIAAGEDPRFIARRLVILASEDIGLADPTALQTAVAAADAVAFIGMPEGRINLAQAVIALALAPKSNAVIMAIDAALADVHAGKIGLVPPHLRDAHYAGAKTYGHGKGYLYAHDQPRGIAAQQYLPDELVDAAYYTPTDHGAEAAMGQRSPDQRAARARPGLVPGWSAGQPDRTLGPVQLDLDALLPHLDHAGGVEVAGHVAGRVHRAPPRLAPTTRAASLGQIVFSGSRCRSSVRMVAASRSARPSALGGSHHGSPRSPSATFASWTRARAV